MTAPPGGDMKGTSHDQDHPAQRRVFLPLLRGQDRKGAEGAARRLRAKVHFNTGRIEVAHDQTAAPVDTLVQTIRATGYEARPAAF